MWQTGSVGKAAFSPHNGGLKKSPELGVQGSLSSFQELCDYRQKRLFLSPTFHFSTGKVGLIHLENLLLLNAERAC